MQNAQFKVKNVQVVQNAQCTGCILCSLRCPHHVLYRATCAQDICDLVQPVKVHSVEGRGYVRGKVC